MKYAMWHIWAFVVMVIVIYVLVIWLFFRLRKHMEADRFAESSIDARKVNQLLNLVVSEARRSHTEKMFLDVRIPEKIISKCRDYHSRLDSPAFLQMTLHLERINSLNADWKITPGTNINAAFVNEENEQERKTLAKYIIEAAETIRNTI